MDSIDLSGKKYISSKQAAKLTGYAQDYVGQLAREEKVPATRVGRSWYIDEKAILTHAGVTSPAVPVPQGTERPQIAHTVSQSANKKSLQTLQREASHQTGFKTWSSISYLEDHQSDLIPSIGKLGNRETPIKIHRITNKNIATSEKLMYSKTPSSDIKSKVSDLKNINQMRLFPLGLTFAAMGILLIAGAAVSGVYVPDSWNFTANSVALTEGINSEYNSILSLFVSFLKEGVQLIVTFSSFFVDSAGYFFQLGIDFFSRLL